MLLIDHIVLRSGALVSATNFKQMAIEAMASCDAYFTCISERFSVSQSLHLFKKSSKKSKKQKQNKKSYRIEKCLFSTVPNNCSDRPDSHKSLIKFQIGII
jgi:hypothetical protein